MKTKRLSKLLFATSLVVAAVFAFQTLGNPGSAMKSNSTYVGMGDLRRYEAAQAFPKTGVTARNQPDVGMGDLRRYEAAQAFPETGVTASNQPYVGMGDLRRYEFEQEEHKNR
jgi:hypothetical protein